jgi:hypothetical protein
MMTCEQCLSELTTGSLRQMSADSPVMLHCASCPECSHLTTLLRDREYNAANVLNNLPPMSNPISLAETSVRTAQRRRVGRVVVMLSGAALVVTIWLALANTIIPAMNSSEMGARKTLRTETISLQCLSPKQAADVISPYIREAGSTYYLPTSGISAITVRGSPGEIAKARSLIDQFEPDAGAACRVSPADLAQRAAGLKDRLGQAGAGNAEPVIATDKIPTAPKKH